MTVHPTRRRSRLRPTLRLRLTLLNGVLLIGAFTLVQLRFNRRTSHYEVR